MSFPRHRSEYGTFNDADTRPQAPLHLHTLPKGHGPASSSSRISTAYSLSSLEYAPAFVKAVGEYDELGRRVGDGFDDDGVGKGKGKRKEGEALAFWRGLDLAPREALSSTSSTPHRSQDTNAAESPRSPPQVATTRPIPQQSEKTPDSAPLARPLVVPREQWFIRKALLAKAQREQETVAAGSSNTDRRHASSTAGTESPAAAAGSGTTTPAATRGSTPSLASLLSTSLPPPPTATNGNAGQEEIEAYHLPAYFHLKPNNKGWQVLRKIGWDESGGLGRSEEGQGSVERTQTGRDAIGGQVKQESGLRDGKAKSKAAEDAVIDLTLDSCSDSDGEITRADVTTMHEKFGQDILAACNPTSSSRNHASGSGAGRTAPVATYFKTDMRGIGAVSAAEQKRNLVRPSSSLAASSSSPSSSTLASAAGKRKRVTHTNDEILAVAREKRRTGEGLMGEEKVAFDMKKAKRDVKVDRKERQKWREIINM
ncbi:hypothetical protein QFC21_006321 [Naganishia friedmannii]|uniref:Uncharacterized protein n=1 Tax=Naganishia friedmannii TaxID=89922 RepID=A0ACC2V3M6_9TREE|nr:hypothetical protein QFC21_006321 [Naganishia friedmannii]